mgnify:CR=1 FL=1|tara:strand:+ start:2856 stop:3281 length:426 start_codon:yes stop_codon:yes gene_type:complete
MTIKNERKLIEEILKKSYGNANKGIVKNITVPIVNKTLKQFKMTPAELQHAAAQYVKADKNRLTYLYRYPKAVIALMIIISEYNIKDSYSSPDGKIWRRKFNYLFPEKITQSTWQKLINKIKKDFKLTKAGDYSKPHVMGQ